MEFDLTTGIFIVIIFLLLRWYVSDDCGPCSGNVEGMADQPSPQFGVSQGSAQTQTSAHTGVSQGSAQTHASAQHIGGSSHSNTGWFDNWRPWSNSWGGYWNRLPSYYDYDISPRDYYGISMYSALAYNNPYNSYGNYPHNYYPYRYDDMNAENYELVYDELGRQRVIRKAVIVG